jgi:MinD-like ATPase involved in chromosome partitioning or flagellar assembly
VDVILGLAPKLNLFHLFHEGVTLDQILLDTPYGFRILPASSGVAEMVSLDTGQKLDLLASMDALEGDIDYLIVDTGAGISENVLYFNLAAQERLLVLTPEPTSLTAAYALVKVLKNQHGVERFRVLVNMVRPLSLRGFPGPGGRHPPGPGHEEGRGAADPDLQARPGLRCGQGPGGDRADHQLLEDGGKDRWQY